MLNVLETSILNEKLLFNKTQALDEASKCLNCFDAPCSKICPTKINIPKFIKQISNDNIKGSAKTILDSNILGYSTSCVCPAEILCEKACVYNNPKTTPVKIARLQQYATKTAINKFGLINILKFSKAKTHKKIALIGSGPSSLTVASELALNGYKTVIFEKNYLAGGLNALGIAPYKLKQKCAQKEINWIINLGIEIRTGIEIDFQNNLNNKKNSLYNLLKNYDAIFLGIGLGKDLFLPLENISCKGIIGALELIENIKTNKRFSLNKVKTAHIIGGGNTAVDIAHQLKLLGVKNVIIIYRRNKIDMPCYKFELQNALAIGVHLSENTIVEKILQKNNNFSGIKVKNIKLKKTGSFESDLLVMAIGQNQNTNLTNNIFGIKLNHKRHIKVNSLTGQTGNQKIFAAGDCVNGGKEVVNAVAESKIIAKKIIQYLNNQLKDMP